MYVRGLLSVPGRKSISRISDQVSGVGVDQCLQQFVNQSPWRWELVRRALARHAATTFRPDAWAVEEVVFPKNGGNSVGVARQYATSTRRMMNCQLGLAVLMMNEEAGCAVNWRLRLPESWDDDSSRRVSARLPDEQRHQSRWHDLIGALDEMAVEWGTLVAPVLVDARRQRQVRVLLLGLEDRGYPYLVRVSDRAVVLPATPGATARRVVSAGELAARAATRGLITFDGHPRADSRLVDLRYAVSPISEGCPAEEPVRRSAPRPRRLLAEWSTGGRRLTGVWLTNLTTAALPELIGLTRRGAQARTEITRLQENYGLGHFEGRSFAGWHHHVTLASVAHAYRMCQNLRSWTELDSIRF